MRVKPVFSEVFLCIDIDSSIISGNQKLIMSIIKMDQYQVLRINWVLAGPIEIGMFMRYSEHLMFVY